MRIYIWPHTDYDYDEHANTEGGGGGGGRGGSSMAAGDSLALLSERLSDTKSLCENGLITEEEHVLARRSALG